MPRDNRRWCSNSPAANEHRRSLRKRIPKLTVEKLAGNSLDALELYRAGALNDNWVTFSEPSFRWPGIRNLRAVHYMLHIELRNQAVPQEIRVSWTRCNYGGFRPWLHCPCGRRVGRLFKGFGGYCCRSCCGDAIYESQRRSRKARLYLQAYRVRQRLGWSRPVIDAIPQRPSGMKRATYARLRARIEQLERPLVGSRVVRQAPLWIRPLAY
jgi:hypothetical protein